MTGKDGGRLIGRVAAILIARIAVPESLPAWIATARQTTVRQLKERIQEARRSETHWPAPLNRHAEATVSDESDASAVSEDHDLSDRVLIRLPMPLAIRAAFEEALDLHRAVSGHEATVTSFVEALTAEAFAGLHPPDVDCFPVHPSPDPAVIEQALARATGNWRELEGSPEDPGKLDALEESREMLERIGRTFSESVPESTDRLESLLRELIALEDDIERSLGRLLQEMGERGAWASLLFAGLGHYAEQRLGISRTCAEDRARLARGLRCLPLLREAYEGGRIGFEAALTVQRILGGGPHEADIERAWVERAEEATIKRLRDEARLLARAEAMRVCEVSTGNRQPSRDGQSARDDQSAGDGQPAGHHDFASRAPSLLPPSDRLWHNSLRRRAGTATSRITSLGRCAATYASADVFLRLRLPEDIAGSFIGCLESRRRQLAEAIEQTARREPCPDSAAPGSILAARTFSIRRRPVPAWVGLLSLIEEYVWTWDDPRQSPRRGAEAIYARDGWRCMAPACTSRRNLEDHHVTYRSRGGENAMSNRLCLCRFHHQQGEHGGLAWCRGTAPLGIRWRLGRKGEGGDFRNERRGVEVARRIM